MIGRRGLLAGLLASAASAAGAQLRPGMSPGMRAGFRVFAGLSGIAAPVISQTSAAGASPFAWRTANDPTFMAGMYWHVQRATSFANLTAGTLNGEAIQQITPQDLASGTTTFPGLGSTPDGSLALRERVGREDGAGGYVWGDWSNVLTDTIDAIPTGVTFDSTTRHATASFVNGNPLILTGNNTQGANQGCKVNASKSPGAATNSKAYIEASCGTSQTAAIRTISIYAAATVSSGNNFVVPGQNGVPGVSYQSNGQIYVNGSATISGQPSWGDSDVVGWYFDLNIGKVWFHKNGSWIAASGSPTSGPGISFNTSANMRAGAGCYRNNPITIRPRAADQQYRGDLQPYGA